MQDPRMCFTRLHHAGHYLWLPTRNHTGKSSSLGVMLPRRSSKPIAGRYDSTHCMYHACWLTPAIQLANTVPDARKLNRFLSEVLPDKLGVAKKNPMLNKIKTKEDFIEDATRALKLAPMAVRLTPHLLSVIDWNNPLDDPIRRQFLPLASGIIPDHKGLKLDSLNEQEDSRMCCIQQL